MYCKSYILSLAFALMTFTGDSLGAPMSPDPDRHLVLQSAPEASVTSVAVSPDGSLVAADSFDGRTRLYDARTGALIRAIDTGGGRGVRFALDGLSLACAGYHMDRLVGIYEVATGKLLRKLAGHTEIETYAVAFSPDGRLFASAGTDKQILVWELATGTLRHRIADQALPVTALAFSPDSATLVSGGGDRVIHFWDMETCRLRRSLEGHADWVVSIVFSTDGRRIASSSCDWAYHRGRDTSYFAGRDPGCNSQWKLWDATTGRLERTVTLPGRLSSLAFAPDGSSLACGIGRDVRMLDPGSEAPGRVVTSHEADVTSVAFTPDGRAILSASHDQTVKRVSLPEGRTDWHLPGHWEQVNSVAVSRDSSLIATGSSDLRYAVRVRKVGDKTLVPGAVRLWNARTGRLLRRLGTTDEQIMAVDLSPDGSRIVAGGGNADGSGGVRLWDSVTGATVWSVNDHRAEVLATSFVPDGSLIASADADGLIKLRDSRTGAVMRTLGGHDGGATALAFSRDGTLLVCGERRGGTRLWDVPSGRLLRTCRAKGTQAGTVTTDRLFTSVALGPDGLLAVCPATMGNTFGEPVRFWDTRTGALRREFAAQQVHGRPIALSPDGTILAAGGKTVKLWDVRTGKLLRELFGHLKKTQSLTFSADGRILASGGSYGTTNLWEVSTGRHMVTLFAFPERRDDSVSDRWLAYTPEGYYDGSPDVDRFLAWRVGDELLTPESLGPRLHRPEKLESALKLPPDNPAVP